LGKAGEWGISGTKGEKGVYMGKRREGGHKWAKGDRFRKRGAKGKKFGRRGEKRISLA